MSSEELFWAKVKKTDTCWEWQGSLHYKGYGVLCRRIDGISKGIKAHRFSYELVKGKIPEGMQLDHLCRNRACVRPDHLEVVTNRENVIRGNTVLNKKTKYPLGVNRVGNRYRALVRADGRQHHLGYFDTPEEAGLAYKEFTHGVAA